MSRPSCWHCGSRNTEVNSQMNGLRDHGGFPARFRCERWWVVCCDCQASGPVEDSMEKAIDAWNRRTLSPAVRELVEAAKSIDQHYRTGDGDELDWIDVCGDRLLAAINAVERDVSSG